MFTCQALAGSIPASWVSGRFSYLLGLPPLSASYGPGAHLALDVSRNALGSQIPTAGTRSAPLLKCQRQWADLKQLGADMMPCAALPVDLILQPGNLDLCGCPAANLTLLAEPGPDSTPNGAETPASIPVCGATPDHTSCS